LDKNMYKCAAIIATFFLATLICTAQMGGASFGDASALGVPLQVPPTPLNGPAVSGPSSSISNPSNDAPTATRPEVGSEPQMSLAPSTGTVSSDLGQGEPISKDQMLSVGTISGQGEGESGGLLGATGVGATGVGATGFGGVQYWVLYNGMWSYGPAAIYHSQKTNTVVSNDRFQNIWSYERYSGGYEIWKYWGRWYPGDYNTWFYGDSNGWHMIAIYGDISGWSNPIWINVVPYSPYYSGDNPHPSWPGEGDWLGGTDIEIAGSGGDINIHGTGDISFHESMSMG